MDNRTIKKYVLAFSAIVGAIATAMVTILDTLEGTV